MNYINIVKIINRLSFILSLFNYFFAIAGHKNSNDFMFIWVCFFAYIIKVINDKNFKYSLLPSAICFVPAIFSTSIYQFIFNMAFIICGIYISYKELNSNDYECEIDSFKKGLLAYIILLLIVIITMDFEVINKFSAQFIIIYLVSAIVILRTSRFLKYNSGDKNARKINLRYTIVMIIASIIFSIEVVRNTISSGIKVAYLYIMEMLFYLFGWVLIGIGYAMNFIFVNFNKLLSKLKGTSYDQSKLSKIMKSKSQQMDKDYALSIILNNQIFRIVIKVIVLLLVIYIIYKIVKGLTEGKRVKEDCIEDREFIKREKKDKNSLLKNIISIIKPGDAAGSIRYYYKKFMLLCIKKDLSIYESDTTKDINKSAEKIFDNNLLKEFRNIYIKIRYGNSDCTINDAKAFGKYYTNIKKSSKQE